MKIITINFKGLFNALFGTLFGRKLVKFSNTPIFIRDENKMIVYRFNHGNKSPFTHDKVVWNHKAKSAKASNPKGMFAFSNDSYIYAFLGMHYNAIDPELDEISFLKLEIDKTKIISENSIEISFPYCNIIEILTLEQYVIREMPVNYPLIEAYKKVRAYPTNENKNKFMAVYDNTKSKGYVRLEEMKKEHEQKMEQLKKEFLQDMRTI